jgi:hypothetical protein
LAIGELEKDWTQYPIIYIDLNLATYQSTDNLYNVLDEILKEHEQEWEVTSITKELSLRFGNLIQAARKRAGQRVVVLADEYDKPLLDTLQNEPLNRSLRQMLRGFYGIIKSANADLRFAFLTGITKFSKVGVFSELNHLADISFDNECAGLCGISETELTKNYLIPYESDRRTFVKIGVEFCDEERTVKRWILA